MRTTTEIGETALGIKSDFSIGQVTEQIEFIFIPFFGKILNSLFLGHFFTQIRIAMFGQLVHLLFQCGKIFLGHFPIAEVHIVIKTFRTFQCRSYPEFNSREKTFHRFCHQVGGRVPEG